MSKIEMIQEKVNDLGAAFGEYDMTCEEWMALCEEAKVNLAEMISLAFSYGRVHGYQAAKEIM